MIIIVITYEIQAQREQQFKLHWCSLLSAQNALWIVASQTLFVPFHLLLRLRRRGYSCHNNRAYGALAKQLISNGQSGAEARSVVHQGSF